ncbi:DUF3231 family protein [Bacillus sp. HMF5848]|uniref:DUF3231 family protein n=1 Tax=Bacillus sp. HMF5848 TaxID=2495421 RepID=UPI000F799EA3|nr:DUF3231 family protein [Bacillus sp. HMF5848]RSK26590.1 DUF3231 family protein [Bacillus sp. HMF5848]
MVNLNIQTCSLGKALCIGFSQVSNSKGVTNFFIKSRDKETKHIEMLSNKLNDSHLKTPITWNDTVTNSTVASFSEKLMLFHINAIMATAVADYGIALASSVRKDLSLMYATFIAEMGLHLEDGAELIWKNHLKQVTGIN